MTQHRSTCPKEEVACQYSFMSYKCHKKMKREDTPQHNKENMKEHYSNIIIPLGFISIFVVLILASTIYELLMIYLTLVTKFGETQE